MPIFKTWIHYWIFDPFWGGIDYLTHYGLRLLPIGIVSNIGCILGKLTGKHRYPEVNIYVSDTLKIIHLDTTMLTNSQFLETMWGNMGRVIAELSIVDKIGDDRIVYHNEHYITDTSKPGDPTIFVFIHLGNWELITHAIKKHGFILSAVYESLPNRFQRRLAKTARERRGYKPISPNFSGTKHLIKVLEQGESVGLAIDEFKNEQVKSPSFGRRIEGSTNIELAIKLSRKFNAPIIPVYCVRKTGANFDIYWEKPLLAYELKEKEIKIIARDVEGRCETWLRNHIEQWYMLHRLKL